MNFAPSARTPLSLMVKICGQTFLDHCTVPALFKETWQQGWLNVKEHIESIVSLYGRENSSEV